jgi:hypothetical protein
MTSSEKNPTPEQMREVFQRMQFRMRNTALHQFDHIDLRTVKALEVIGLAEGFTTDPVFSIGEGVDLEVLQDPRHPRRVKLSSGPLVIYVTQENPPTRLIIELPLLFYSDLLDVRSTAFNCVNRMVTEDELDVTPKTKAALEAFRDGILSKVPAEWRPAAIALCDAFIDDVLVALQGTRQCLECEPVIQDSLNTYVPRIIHPTISSLDSIDLYVRSPENEHLRLEEVVADSVAEACKLSDACSRYYSRLGYLPLAPAYSMAEVVSRWTATHPDTEVWAEIWNWARDASGPLPRYHACAVFVVHPELVPSGQFPVLWREILAMVNNADTKGSDNIEHERWALRRDLARHFAYHLEAHLPDNNGANIACFAWWFSEKFTSIFQDKAESAQFYRENWVAPALDQSTRVWLDASPRVERCILRYVTTSMSYPWATALLALMGPKFDKLAPHEQSDEIRTLFHQALISCLVESIPFSIDTPSTATYAQECSLAEIALKWAFHVPEQEQKDLKQFVATNRTLGTMDGLCDALRNLCEYELPYQLAVCIALKAKVYTDPTVAEGVWGVVSDADWRKNILGVVKQQVQAQLIESLNMLLVDNRDKWSSHLPHYLAELCEKEVDEERRRVLFQYVIMTSLASDTMSAIRRLLRGDQKAKFVGYVKEYRERVDAMRSVYPPWVADKLRGLMVIMHVY